MSILRNILPDIVPDEEIVVEEETHTFRKTEYSDGTVQSQKKYVLDKAPVKSVENVEAKVNGSEKTLVSGQDYVLSDGKTTIDFSVGGENPDGNTEFYVTYRCRSIIDRYIESHEEVLEEVDNKKDTSIAANFVEKAEGQQLDEIGKLFGVIGQRSGRNDERYRIYLKSISESFISRGTVENMKEAVSTASGIPPEDITIQEDFQNNAYRVFLVPSTVVTTEIIAEISEIADPSGVKLAGIGFKIPNESVNINDSVVIVRKGKETIETVNSSDVILVNPNKNSIAVEETTSSDSVSFEIQKGVWNTANWDQVNWIREVN
jgi:hypothetical protein